jgi:predicted metal-binding membrane protein
VLQALFERDRAAVAVCLLIVVLLAWAWLARHAGMAMQPHFALLFVMWSVMMVAMMLPSAAPMILLFATVSAHQREQGKPYVPTALFAGTYLAVWGAFSLVAAAAQWWLEQRLGSLMSTDMSSRALSGALLLAAGVYQLTPLKYACLRQCQSPMHFVMTRWRPGLAGALRMGAEHGAYCVGCCWLLMALLFAGGMMNLWWVVGIALYVLVEKTLAAGPRLSRALGAALVAGGLVMLAGSLNA